MKKLKRIEENLPGLRESIRRNFPFGFPVANKIRVSHYGRHNELRLIIPCIVNFGGELLNINITISQNLEIFSVFYSISRKTRREIEKSRLREKLEEDTRTWIYINDSIFDNLCKMF